MGPFTYVLFAYAATAAISFAVIAVIVGIDRVMSRSDKTGKEA